LDVSFKEDLSRIRKNHGPANMVILRKVALNILKTDTNSKISIRKKKMKAAMKLSYLEELLSQSTVLET
jgi:hypothetical protein